MVYFIFLCFSEKNNLNINVYLMIGLLQVAAMKYGNMDYSVPMLQSITKT